MKTWEERLSRCPAADGTGPGRRRGGRREQTMPLTMAEIGEQQRVVKIGGREETKRHLHDLGFVEGSRVTVVSELAGNLIVSVKDTRVALDRALASKILV